MSLGGTFETATGRPRAPQTARRVPRIPFSIKLSEDERATLEGLAAGVPLGAYIKWRLLEGVRLPPPKPKSRTRRSGKPVADRAALAQALALLGASRIASNLNQLAHAANIGAVPVDQETVADLNEAVALVREIRAALVAALGLKASEDRP